MLRGRVDVLTRFAVGGWAADDDKADAVVEVSVFIDDRKITQITCDRLRADLKQAGTFGNGAHAFQLVFHEPLAKDTSTRVTVRFSDTDKLLENGDIVIPPNDSALNSAHPAERLPMKLKPILDEVISETGETVTFRMSERLWQIFRDHRVSFGWAGYKGLPDVTIRRDAKIEPWFDYMGLARYIGSSGAFSYSQSASTQFASIGRYCSIAANVRTMGARHSVEHVTTSAFTNHLDKPAFMWARGDLLGGNCTIIHPSVGTKDVPTVEDDVWIGNDALIQRGVTLRTGCVVGAGAVVVKDVPPYAIVGGVPARTIRMRFSENISERLLASRWWDLHPRALFDLDVTDPPAFLDGIADRSGDKLDAKVLTLDDIAQRLAR